MKKSQRTFFALLAALIFGLPGLASATKYAVNTGSYLVFEGMPGSWGTDAFVDIVDNGDGTASVSLSGGSLAQLSLTQTLTAFTVTGGVTSHFAMSGQGYKSNNTAGNIGSITVGGTTKSFGWTGDYLGYAFAVAVNAAGALEGHGWFINSAGNYVGDIHFTGQQTAVPEPATMALLASGAAGLAARRRKNVAA